jgi:hypothetical protein
MMGSNDPYISGVRQFNTNAPAYKFVHQYKEFPNAGHDFGFRPVGATDKGNAGEDSTIAWSMAFLKERGLLPSSATAIGPVKQEARALRKGPEADNLRYYTVQGRLLRARSGAASASQRSALAYPAAIAAP